MSSPTGMFLKWWNLKRNKCPQCNKDWAMDLTAVDGLLAHGCGFKIRESKYKSIVAGMVESELPVKDYPSQPRRRYKHGYRILE